MVNHEHFIQLQPGAYAFCSLPPGESPPPETIAWFREAECPSIVLPMETAVAVGCAIEFAAAWIVLDVHARLSDVGLTARVSTALAAAGIACNVIAACRHDHLFVPVDRAADAVRILAGLAFP